MAMLMDMLGATSMNCLGGIGPFGRPFLGKRSRMTRSLKSKFAVAALVSMTVAGCNKPAPPTEAARPVRTVTVEHRAEGEIVSLTGHVRAKDQASLAFRLDGRMIERPVNVGDVLKAGQVVARLDPQIPDNALR